MTSLAVDSVALSPTALPVTKTDFAQPASRAQLERVAEGLGRRGISAVIVGSATEARAKLYELLPPSGSILEASSQTLTSIGLETAELARRGLEPVKPKLMELYQAGRHEERRRLGAAPDIVVGSVHALTEDGIALIASASGSQLGPYASGAGRVFWVVGAQKIVPDLAAAYRRLEEHVFPLEDARARKAYGQGSSIAKVLVVHREFQPGRVTVILVEEPLGF